MKTNKLIKLPEDVKRSIELNTVGHLTKLVANASEIKLSDRVTYLVKGFEKLLNEEKSILTHDKLELEKALSEVKLKLQDISKDNILMKGQVENLKRQIK